MFLPAWSLEVFTIGLSLLSYLRQSSQILFLKTQIEFYVAQATCEIRFSTGLNGQCCISLQEGTEILAKSRVSLIFKSAFLTKVIFPLMMPFSNSVNKKFDIF